jgi:hypothetical protein
MVRKSTFLGHTSNENFIDPAKVEKKYGSFPWSVGERNQASEVKKVKNVLNKQKSRYYFF